MHNLKVPTTQASQRLAASMEGNGAITGSRGMKRKETSSEIDDEEDVKQAAVIDGIGSKHGDGSIYRLEEHQLHRLYRLHDTRETRLEPMRLSLPTKNCYPCFTNCKRHIHATMLQIYSLKLNLPSKATPPGGGPVHLYGFMAARDLLDPLRNYVFNRTRDDPFIIQDINSDPFIYMSGPKRGVYLQCPILIEYDMWIKTGQDEKDDRTLIDGAFICSELTYIRGTITNRIEGGFDGASVDISRALFRGAVEATVEVQIVELAERGDAGGSGLDLSVSGFVPPIKEEIKLFRGAVDKPCVLNRFVVAVFSDSFLLVFFKVAGAPPDQTGKFAFRAVPHGSISSRQNFSFATVEVNVTWSGIC